MTSLDEWIDSIWTAVRSDFGCYVFIVGEEGEIIFLNASAERWMNGEKASIQPRSLFDLFPKHVASERISFVGEALSSGSPIVVDGLIGGEGLRNTIRPLPASSEHPRAALFVFQPLSQLVGSSDSRNELPTRRVARHNDLGMLERLTPRELQVLTLIARGLSSNAIAEKLHRSRRTIDCHRASIGHKLDIESRADLALIAVRAGLIRYVDVISGHAGDARETRLFNELISAIRGTQYTPGARSERSVLSS